MLESRIRETEELAQDQMASQCETGMFEFGSDFKVDFLHSSKKHLFENRSGI